jgi:hypothetical protein
LIWKHGWGETEGPPSLRTKEYYPFSSNNLLIIRLPPSGFYAVPPDLNLGNRGDIKVDEGKYKKNEMVVA